MIAWLVHIFTASGAVLGLFALEATFRGDHLFAFLLLALSVVIDSVDGFFARLVNVENRTPQFDGALLDNLVDFVNYVTVPAAMLLVGPYIPRGFREIAAVAVLLASVYQFCHRDAKTEDHFFRGFPSYWSIVVFYFFMFASSPALNVFIVFSLVSLSFVPIHFIYPSRMPNLFGNRFITTAFQWATLAWGAAIFFVLWSYPYSAPRVLDYILLYSIAYMGLSVLDHGVRIIRRSSSGGFLSPDADV
jgi:phosphatidylcholine synthase